MFPTFNLSGVIPPYAAANPAVGGPRSPYMTNLSTVILQLGRNAARLTLISGLLKYRQAMSRAGITTGFQLIDGSFTEDCETLRGRPPNDIDVVTFAELPVASANVPAFVSAHQHLFDQTQTKAAYGCDAYFVDLGKDRELLVEDSFYWYGLFSHQRVTHTWKGMLQIPLVADDAIASGILAAQPGAPNGP